MQSVNSKALFWSVLNNISKLVSAFVAPIILARILGPESFGIIAMAFVLVGLSQIFIDFGSTDAIVKSKNITKKFLSSLFWFNLLICILVFLFLILLTPFVANFFQRDQLQIIIPLLSLSMFFQVVSIVPTSIFRRQKDFKSITLCDANSRIFSTIFAILTALYDFGVYSLVVLSVSQSIIYCILINFYSKNYLRVYFSFRYIRLVFSFTATMFYIKVINHFERQSDRFFIGPSYGDAILGIFSRGQAFQKSLQRFINGSFNPVLFSIITRENSNTFLKSSLEKSYQGFFLIMFPLFLYFFFFSNDLVLFLFGNEWIFMSELLPYFSILFLIRPFQKINQEIIKAKGNVYFLGLCFTFLTPLLIACYYFMPSDLGIFGYIYAYVLVSVLLFVFSSIYLTNLAKLNSYFFPKIFFTFLPRIIFLVTTTWILRNYILTNDFYFLNLFVFGLFLIFAMIIMQKLHFMEVHENFKTLMIQNLKSLKIKLS